MCVCVRAALNDCRTTGCVNGDCQDTGSGYECACPRGFSGARCEKDVCSPSPCRNGGRCVAESALRWSCRCPPGYRGSTCDVAFPCDSQPCQNGGECLQTTDGRYRSVWWSVVVSQCRGQCRSVWWSVVVSQRGGQCGGQLWSVNVVVSAGQCGGQLWSVGLVVSTGQSVWWSV